MAVSVRTVHVDEFSKLIPTLTELLIATVETEASLGFLPPLAPTDARAYWMSLSSDLRAGRRVLVGAFSEDRIVGSGQLSFPVWPNAKHRAELQKLFVDGTRHGQGVGRRLMAGLHAAARARGRSLILLNARRPVAEGFYKPLGYKEIGVVPGYSLGSDGGRIDSVSLYQDLGSESNFNDEIRV
jgi:GNAT superfamily N-acetyltransferase